MEQTFLIVLLCLTLSGISSSFPSPQGDNAESSSSDMIFFPPDDADELSFEDRVKQRLPPGLRPTTTTEPTTTTTEIAVDDYEDFLALTNDENRPDSSSSPFPPLDWVEECATDGAFPFKNASSPEGWTCHGLATQGPCEDAGEWFVLDNALPGEEDFGSDSEQSSVQGVCQKKRCENENHVWFEGKCVNLNSEELCPRGMEMLVNPFGEGGCDCREDFHPHVNPLTDALECFQLNLQGPCDDGFQLVLNAGEEDNDLIEGSICEATDCPSGQVRWTNDQCLDQVNCEDVGGFVEYDEKFNILTCGHVTRQLLILEKTCPEGQSLNSEGECKEATRSGLAPRKKRRRKRLATGSLGLTSFLRQRFAGR